MSRIDVVINLNFFHSSINAEYVGAERRKKKTVHKQNVTDDTKLMTMLKKYSKLLFSFYNSRL